MNLLCHLKFGLGPCFDSQAGHDISCRENLEQRFGPFIGAVTKYGRHEVFLL